MTRAASRWAPLIGAVALIAGALAFVGQSAYRSIFHPPFDPVAAIEFQVLEGPRGSAEAFGWIAKRCVGGWRERGQRGATLVEWLFMDAGRGRPVSGDSVVLRETPATGAADRPCGFSYVRRTLPGMAGRPFVLRTTHRHPTHSRILIVCTFGPWGEYVEGPANRKLGCYETDGGVAPAPPLFRRGLF